MPSVLRSCRRAASAVRAAPLSSLAGSVPVRPRAVASFPPPATRTPVVAALARRAHFSTQTFERTAGAANEGGEESQAEAAGSDPETQILKNAIHHVAAHGWTVEALAAGARDVGYPSVAHGMFSRGAIELVEFFMDDCNAQLRAKLAANADLLQAMSVTERVKFGVRARLELLEPVLATWPQAMALGALPSNVPGTMKRLATLADEIWYFAGDQSSDASWYTKRAVLTTVYASTELFLLSDHSVGFQDTWAFLDRRVDETIALGELPRNLNDVAGMASIGLQSVFSAVTSLAGPLGAQLVANSPLANVPNPISAVSSSMPAAVASTLAAGFPPNPLGSAASPGSSSQAGADFEPKDLHEIDAELEKLGGASDKPSA